MYIPESKEWTERWKRWHEALESDNFRSEVEK